MEIVVKTAEARRQSVDGARLLAERDRLPGERLSVGMFAAARMDKRLHLPPEDLRRDVHARERHQAAGVT